MADAISGGLRDGDARRALVAFDAIASENHSSQSFVRHALDRLSQLVGSELTTLSLCDLEQQRRIVIGRPGEALSDDDRAAFDRHFREHPLVRYHSTHPGGPTQRITDCISPRDFRDSLVFADYYRRIGIKHVMALPLRIDDVTVVSVVFHRSGANFGDVDRAVIDILRPPLAALYRTIMAREEARLGQASLKRIAARAGWYTAKVKSDTCLIDVSPDTVQMLQHSFRDAPKSERGEPPAALRQWLRRRSVNWGLEWFYPGTAAPYVIMRGGLKLTVHFIPDPLTPARGELVMRRERAAMGSDELGALPLTRREREVLAILASGKTNDEIASVLAISPRTVQKHLEHVFDKLGVETRMAAAMCAMAAARESGDDS
jgi:DNA-binding CsgD family transcriptional regulator